MFLVFWQVPLAVPENRSDFRLLCMPRLRETANSISSLEEQNLLHRIMSEAGNAPKNLTPSEDGGKKGRKGKQGKAKQNGREGDDPVTPNEPRTGLVTHGPGVTMTTTTPALSTAAMQFATQPVTQLATGLPLQQMQLPYLVPQMAQPFPAFYQPPMGQYAGYGAPMMYPTGEEEWEVESQASAALGAERQVHDIADDEEETEAQATPKEGKVEEEEELDFSEFPEGKLQGILKDSHNKVGEVDRMGPPIHKSLAKVLNELADENKVGIELEKLVKTYPKVKNLEKITVPKLETELFVAMDQTARNGDVALQNVQKAMVASISAMAPLLSVMLQRRSTDDELEKYSDNIVDAVKMLTLANKTLSVKRRESLRPYMQATYAKSLGKGKETSPEWLFGGNLSEATRQCEMAKKIAEKVFKRKQQAQGNQNQQQRGTGNNQNKRFRQSGANWNNKKTNQFTAKTFGYQNVQMPAQGQLQYQYPQQQYYVPYRQSGQQSYRQQGQNHQDFQPRGAKK